jgi:hypothetical protein
VERSQREDAGPRYQQGARLSWPGKVSRDDWQQMGISPLTVTQDAIIRAGKIYFFNTRLTPESAARFQAARKKNWAATCVTKKDDDPRSVGLV